MKEFGGRDGNIRILVAVFSICIVVKMETYADTCSDVMAWLYGGSPSTGKANQFLEST